MLSFSASGCSGYIIAIIVAGFTSAAAVTASGADISAAIEGHVLASPDLQPLLGVRVELSRGLEPDDAGDDSDLFYVSRVFTDHQGYYRFDGLEPRAYCVRIWSFKAGAQHYLGAACFNIQTQPGGTAVVDIQLRQAGYIYGYVYGEAGAPIKNAVVSVNARDTADSPSRHEGRTDAAGRYEIPVPLTSCRFYPVRADGPPPYVPELAQGLFAGDVTGTRGPDFQLAAGGILHGNAVTEDGIPVSICAVVDMPAWGPGGGAPIIGRTDENGDFWIAGVPPNVDSYIVTKQTRFEADGKVYALARGERYMGPFAVSAGETLELPALIVPEAGSVSGTITDGSGLPLAGAGVEAARIDGAGGAVAGSMTAESGDDGRYELKASPGAYALFACKSGYNSHSSVISISRGQNIVCDIQLSSLEGTVLVSGRIDNFADVAPRNSDGVPLPFELIDEYSFLTGVGVGVWQPGPDSTPDMFLSGAPPIRAQVEDGYADFFQPSDLPAGSFFITVPSGVCALAVGFGGPESARGCWTLLSDIVYVDGQPGQHIEDVSITIPTGASTVTGSVIFPQGYSVASEDYVGIYLMKVGSETGLPRASGIPGPSGDYLLERLPAGDYYIQAVTGGFDPFISDTFTLSDGQTVVRNIVFGIPGDANLDCRIDILDLLFVRNRMLQDVSSGDNWQADVNKDGSINILDLLYVRNRMNQTCK